MGTSTSCAPEAAINPECTQQVASCKEAFVGEDVINRKYLNVQLIAAARDGEVELLRDALRDGANPETRQPMRIIAGAAPVGISIKAAKCMGPTPLMLAAKSGSVACVKALLQHKAKVHAKDEDGMKPIHWAALSGELLAIQALVDAGANPLDKDHDMLGILDHLPAEVRNDPIEFRRWRELRDSGSAVPEEGEAAERGDGAEEPDQSSWDEACCTGTRDRADSAGSMQQGLSGVKQASPFLGTIKKPPLAAVAGETAFLGRVLPKELPDSAGI